MLSPRKTSSRFWSSEINSIQMPLILEVVDAVNEQLYTRYLDHLAGLQPRTSVWSYGHNSHVTVALLCYSANYSANHSANFILVDAIYRSCTTWRFCLTLFRAQIIVAEPTSSTCSRPRD